MVNYNIKLRDARWGFAIIFIVMFTMCTIPISSPIPILPWTQAGYNYIQSLPPGSIILYSNQYGSPGPTFDPFAKAFLFQVMRQHLRLVVVCPALIFVPYTDRVLHEAGLFDPANNFVYGKDFVYLGFMAGMEAGCALLAKDFSAVFASVDYYGNSISSLPLMNDVHNAYDIKLVVIIFDYLPEPYAWIRQWRPIYKVPIILAHYADPSAWLPYYYTGDLIGISSDSDGGAQYETLVGRPGLATALATLTSTLFILEACTIVAGSVVFWVTRYRKKEVKA